MSKLLFPTSVVGSLPRPAFVLDLINDRPPLAPDRYRAAMEAAVRFAVAMQEHAGIDVLTDGEWWRKSYIGVIAELAHGFELGALPDGRPFTLVVDKLSPKTPGFIANEVTFLKTITKKLIKSTLPSPALLGERMWSAEKSAKAYPNRNDFVRACVPVLRRELELIRDAGADSAQIDDPHLCLFVDPEVRAKYADPDAAAAFAVDMINEVVSGVSGIKIAVHLCRRAGGRARGEVEHGGGYGPIIRHLNRLKVHHLTMEFTTPSAGDMAVFKELREDLEIGLGCVDVTPGKIDSAETIAARVRQALKFLAPERITLNPDCGFAPGSGAVVSIDEAYKKLCNEAEAARMLRAEVV
ncbi:MAG: Methionine synthase II (Cobalamin-independent) [Limisphaerales bacterium]|nr:MAG: Methionine synthase II (Cobalamin-independent) [Limisphaerales bacterium]KAG0506966.1 MAG: Methionine synthase II (Cobalamin-independent) [Limisphaerales bacterium]TXT47210.1 MAG: Methionine synthase II (Cobalamin-independent) [Limisphaerales bacterium]